MSWRYRSPDGFVGVVLTPAYDGDLDVLAAEMPIWIASSEANDVLYDHLLKIGSDHNLYEVTLWDWNSGRTAAENVSYVLKELDEEYACYSRLVVFGATATQELLATIASEGFEVLSCLNGRIEARMQIEVRGGLIGRDYVGLRERMSQGRSLSSRSTTPSRSAHRRR